MASAAAVGANAALSPPRNDIGEDRGIPGEVTSAISSKELGVDTNGDMEDEDQDIRATARRRGPIDAGAFDEQYGQQIDDDEEGGDDLFGDDEDGGLEEEPEKPARQLDDEELDSGDDMGRTDRAALETEQPEQEYETQEKITMDLEVSRQPLPEPSDGEMYLLKLPDFLAIEPTSWDHQKYQPPTTDHHSNKPPSATFSPYNTAMSTIRWRRSPSNAAKLQSNTRILRWSDGSLTLQLASEPTVQYEIDGNSLAPPQRNAVKPTPVSVAAIGQKGGRQGDGTIPGERYDHNKDAFTYMVIPSESTSTLRVAHKITAGLSIRQSESVTDDAEERLQAAFARAVNATKVNGVGTADLQLIDEDPEKARKAAEELMRQKVKAEKKREAALQRDSDRVNRTMGRHGISSTRYGGLNVGMLEDEDGMGGGKSRKTGGGPRKSRQRRSSIYSEDEDFGRKRFATKEDEYDEEDDFVAPSDEEEIVDDDEDEDDGIVEEPSERTPKRDRAPPALSADVSGVGDDADADADGEIDEDVPQGPRQKKRRVLEDEEDDE